MKYILILLFLCLNYSASVAQRNVILIIADDVGLEYCGFYEQHGDTVIMPNIRTLLSKGIRFTRAWSNPLCSPTRAGILTGRYSFRTGIGDAVGGQNSNNLDTSELTIPKLLETYKPSGIAKANIGKWHLNNPMPQSNFQIPIKMGYDYYEGNFSGQLPNYYAWNKIKNGVNTPCSTYATIEVTNNAIDWVKSIPSQKPMFLWLAYNAPHTPFHLPPSNLHSYTNLKGTAQDTATSVIPYYKAMCEALDREIGRLFDSLKAINRYDSTDFIFIGDNGSDARVYQGGIRAKGSVYQDGISVPFIVSGPSVVNPGRVSDALINTQDIFATVLELFGYAEWKKAIPLNKPVDSRSLLPIIQNASQSIRDWTFSEVFKTTPAQFDGKTMRNNQYKLIDFDNGSQAFFNLINDPTEKDNLLLKNMSTMERDNYTYLCQEMTTLVGKGGFCTITSIDEYAHDNASVLFDSNHDILILRRHCNDHARIQCISSRGIVMMQQETDPNFENQLSTSSLPSGMYTVKVDCHHTSFNHSIIIQR
jgi:arylsulfatase A-like enzyme